MLVKIGSTDPDLSRHGFSFSKHVRASRHVTFFKALVPPTVPVCIFSNLEMRER